MTSALFREHTKYVHGKHIKDLSYLNRDLRHVVIVDNNPVRSSMLAAGCAVTLAVGADARYGTASYSHQPLNGIGIKPWHGRNP